MRFPSDDAMARLHRLADRVARGQINVLVLGETGAGKEVLAERIHRASPRAGAPFLRLSCAAFTEALLESELFGHERGAFTGAVGAKPGLLETAHGGTVFLDEVGELPPAIQAKLLRVIETRTVLRVGGLAARAIDVRFIAATNRDLEAEAARGAFRADLRFRLDGVTLVVPPLRERVGEIAKLARQFAAEAGLRIDGAPVPVVDDDAIALLEGYAWPGNIRELRNMMERAVLLSRDGHIGVAELPVSKLADTSAADQTPNEIAELRRRIEQLERKRILDALDACGGNQTRAAKLLGMARRTLVSRLGRYAVPRPRK